MRVRLETDGQKDDVRLDRFGQLFGDDPGSDRGRLGGIAFGAARGGNGYFDAASDKCLRQGLTDMAEANDCVFQDVSPISCDAGSDLRHAAIDREIHAGDVRTFIGGKEGDGSCDFLRIAPAAHWDLGGELGCGLFGLLGGKARRRC